jgi:hypothetical protein
MLGLKTIARFPDVIKFTGLLSATAFKVLKRALRKMKFDLGKDERMDLNRAIVSSSV